MRHDLAVVGHAPYSRLVRSGRCPNKRINAKTLATNAAGGTATFIGRSHCGCTHHQRTHPGLAGEPCLFDHASAIGKCGPIFLELIELHEVTPGSSRASTPAVVPVAAISLTSPTSSSTPTLRASA